MASNAKSAKLATPEVALRDLRGYLSRMGFRLSPNSESIFHQVEAVGYETDDVPCIEAFLYSLLANMPSLQALLPGGKKTLRRAMEIIREKCSEKVIGYYCHHFPKPYSRNKSRLLSTSTRVIDLAISSAARKLRREILPADILIGLLACHEESYPVYMNGSWTDKNLHLDEILLTHLTGRYHRELSVSFAAIRDAHSEGEDLPQLFDPIGNAPEDLRPSLRKLFEDWPDYTRNCFLMMSFNPSQFHAEIVQTIRATLKKHGLNCLRADDREYSDQLLQNIRTYVHGSAFGIAVFERISSDNYNPNVSLELGYFFGLNRPVCLLKERTLPRLPSDIVGNLYREFDLGDVKASIVVQVDRWLKDRRIV